jgi:hypothetical protein
MIFGLFMTLQKLFLQRQHSATGWMNLQMFFESEEGAHPVRCSGWDGAAAPLKRVFPPNPG